MSGYTKEELRDIFERCHYAYIDDMEKYGVSDALKIISETLDNLQGIGINAELDVKRGGCPAVFSMHDGVVELHGYLNIDNSKYLMLLGTYRNDDSRLLLRVSKHDVSTGFDYNKYGVDVDCNAKHTFDLKQDDGVKKFQQWMVSIASFNNTVARFDSKNSFNGKDKNNKTIQLRRINKIGNKK